MKHVIPMMTLCFLIIFTGCLVTSIHPFYTENSIVFDATLMGQWTGENESESLTFIRQGEKKYRMFLKEEKDTLEFKAILFKVQEYLFLDLYPLSTQLDDDTFSGMHYLPLHSILLVKQIAPTLQLSSFNHQWLQDQIQSDSLCIAHETVGDRIILTASSNELQQFIISHVQTEGAFERINTFTRKTDL
jgi:hypothetical protein